MDSISRLARLAVFFIVGIFIGGYAAWASAETIAALNGYKAEVYGEGIAYRAETAAAACLMASASSHTAVQTACGGKACVAPWSQVAGTCVGTHPPDAQYPGNTSPFASYSTAKYCPAGQNWTFVGPSSCTRPDCVAPDVRDPATGLCSPPACPESGTPYSSGWYPMGNSPSSSFPGVTCNGTCLVAFNGYAPAGQAIVSGQTQYYARGTWQFLGPSNTCSGGTSTPGAQSSLPPDTCGPNQYYGTINGKPVCINASTGQPDPTSQPPSPSTSQSQSTSVTNNDNSVTTTTTTINSDGSSTVTITTVYPNGDKDQTTTTTPPPGEDQKDAFCKENPDSPLCAKSSYGGTCGAFTCDGDAIQCAIAQHQHQKRCDDENAHTQNSFIAQAKSILEGGSDSVTDPIATPETRSLGSFDTTDMLTAGCPAPRSYTVLGATMTINYQPFCDIAAIVKIFLVVGALLLGGRIVVGGI